MNAILMSIITRIITIDLKRSGPFYTSATRFQRSERIPLLNFWPRKITSTLTNSTISIQLCSKFSFKKMNYFLGSMVSWSLGLQTSVKEVFKLQITTWTIRASSSSGITSELKHLKLFTNGKMSGRVLLRKVMAKRLLSPRKLLPLIVSEQLSIISDFGQGFFGIMAKV